jgi:hypothetical protein
MGTQTGTLTKLVDGNGHGGEVRGVALNLGACSVCGCSFSPDAPLPTWRAFYIYQGGQSMKYKTFTFAVIGCIAGIIFAGCEKTPEQKVEVANQELKEAKADYRAEWQKYKADSEEQIKANEDRIDAFKAKMKKADRKIKTKYYTAVGELERKNRNLKRKLEEYKDEGESKWQEFKTNFSHDMEGIGNTMKDLFKDND